MIFEIQDSILWIVDTLIHAFYYNANKALETRHVLVFQQRRFHDYMNREPNRKLPLILGAESETQRAQHGFE